MGAVDAESGRCKLEAGVLLSNPAMQMLIQYAFLSSQALGRFSSLLVFLLRQRHSCNTILADSEQTAMEMCIQIATNLSCQDTYEVILSSKNILEIVFPKNIQIYCICCISVTFECDDDECYRVDRTSTGQSTLERQLTTVSLDWQKSPHSTIPSRWLRCCQRRTPSPSMTTLSALK